ncbi:MAG TPA: hypothetical protein PKK95_01110 [Vicinamibacterales bacterium]|nr:hypothetical protein [Acidobacteriota bacterium]HOC16831.1 hypothetical protein [Vicinamibacterales bacterium]
MAPTLLPHVTSRAEYSLKGQEQVTGMGSSALRIRETLERIQGEFRELPGLRLTLAQAQRLWRLDKNVCDALLAALVDARFLARTADGAFIRGTAVN